MKKMIDGDTAQQLEGLPNEVADLQDEVSGVKTSVAAKQDKLVSGTNIKSVNGNSLLGSGNITIEGGTTYKAGEYIEISDYNYISANVPWTAEGQYIKPKKPLGYCEIRFYNNASDDYIAFCIMLDTIKEQDISAAIVNLFNQFTGGSYTNIVAVVNAANELWTSQTAYRTKLAQLFLLLPAYNTRGVPCYVYKVNNGIHTYFNNVYFNININEQSGEFIFINYYDETLQAVDLISACTAYNSFMIYPWD